VKDSSYGVIDIRTSKAIIPNHSRITCIERALIDAVVNPHYNGGILSVYTFFKNARNKLNITKFIDIYKQLELTYPYSQSIGFFLDKAGMIKHASAIHAAFAPTHIFFVDHNAKTSWSFDDKWMLYYPAGLIDEN
jgi:predicted transcriptional regulator of viral defense system